MTAVSQTWTEEFVEVAGSKLFLRRAGTGPAVLVLHHDIGDPGELPFYDLLAQRSTVLLPSHPGFGRSERPDWMRNVRDVAAVYQGLLAGQGIENVTLVGLGFGGWIAAEMATLAPRDFARLVLVGAMGVRPPQGEILDQALFNQTQYIHAGFHDAAKFAEVFGDEPSSDDLEAWEINREMVFRIAWKPYMFNPALPHLLGAVKAPALVVWGRQDGVVPLSAGEAYTTSLSDARLEIVENCGHFVDMEQPQELARLIQGFTGA